MSEVEYQDDPQQAQNASEMLLRRGKEMLQNGAVDNIWINLGFHVATARLKYEAHVDIPIGPEAQVYIGLVLAAKEHLEARKMLEAAANGN